MTYLCIIKVAQLGRLWKLIFIIGKYYNFFIKIIIINIEEHQGKWIFSIFSQTYNFENFKQLKLLLIIIINNNNYIILFFGLY